MKYKKSFFTTTVAVTNYVYGYNNNIVKSESYSSQTVVTYFISFTKLCINEQENKYICCHVDTYYNIALQQVNN